MKPTSRPRTGTPRQRRWWRWIPGVAAGLAVVLLGGLHILARVFLGCQPALSGTEKRVVPLPFANGRPLVSYWHCANRPKLTLVFVHGTPATASAFQSQLDGPFPDADRVAYDRPGFGCSPGTFAMANLRAQGAALCALIEQARTPRVVVVGHSYGGPLALLAAARLPERVAGVVTIGGSVSPQEERPWMIQHLGAWPFVAPLLPGAVRRSNEELLFLKADLLWLDGQLPAVRCPVLMLQGDRDRQVPERNVSYLQARFAALGKSAQLQTRMFPGYNHFMMWEQPTMVNAAIGAFLAALGPG